MVAFMEPVRGFDAWIAGEEGAGFTAPDDRTVVIELDEPATYLVPGLVRLVGRRSRGARSLGDENFVLNGAGTGPWQFRVRAGYAVRDGTEPQLLRPTLSILTRIVWPVFNGPDAARTALDLYRDENAASADVPSPCCPRSRKIPR